MGSWQPDVWLSQQIGRAAYRVQEGPLDDLPPGPCFCYAKVRKTDTELIQVLRSAGFYLVETLLTFVKKPSEDGVLDSRLREARASDCERVKQIAESSFRFSRFHADPKFDSALANRIKAAWAENFFQGQRGHRMLVAEERGHLCGFILLVEKPETTAVDLIAVDPAFQGRGVGQALLSAAERKGRRIFAGTQKANATSCRMYQKCGYTVDKSESVLHFHQ